METLMVPSKNSAGEKFLLDFLPKKTDDEEGWGVLEGRIRKDGN